MKFTQAVQQRLQHNGSHRPLHSLTELFADSQTIEEFVSYGNFSIIYEKGREFARTYPTYGLTIEEHLAHLFSVAKLTDEQREVFEAQYYLDEKPRDIANRTGKDIAHIYNMHSKAVENIRRHLSYEQAKALLDLDNDQ